MEQNHTTVGRGKNYSPKEQNKSTCALQQLKIVTKMNHGTNHERKPNKAKWNKMLASMKRIVAMGGTRI
jgi:hypothetical protein